MQVKIVIGTVAFMLTMIILGFAALREPARLAEYTAASEGRSIERGATLFQDNCATCHGVNGRAEECFNVAGEQIGCQGLPLNAAQLVCGDTSERMETLNWDGSKAAFIQRTIAAGRSGTVMPAWSQQFGGPMRDDQVANLTSFVLNWESEDLCAAPAAPAYEWPESAEDFLAEFADGDAERGAELYVSPYGCSGCHGDVDQPGSNAVGPWLGDIAATAGTRVEGQSATQYIYQSILDPNAYIVEECPTGPCAEPSVMAANNFDQRMTPEDMAHILSFLLEQEGE